MQGTDAIAKAIEKAADRITMRLNVVVALELNRPAAEKPPTVSSKVWWLLDCGFAPSEVANVIGKPLSYVTAIKSARAKRRKRKGKGAIA